MPKSKITWLAFASAFVVSIHPVGAQGEAASGLYQIVSGTYTECCGFGGEITSSLPNKNQSFVRLEIDQQTDFATMTFLSADGQTVFGVMPCPPGDAINFRFDFGFVFADNIEFHVDPGPPPYNVSWFYSVTNLTDRLRIDGTLGMAQVNCADVPNHFTHSNVVAVLVQAPTLKVTEFTKEGALLFIQGNAGWTNVVEASTGLGSWSPISTNVMPNTLCPVCPYIVVRDAASTNLASRFYRCFEIP